jgi:DNA-directed RNA polymerase specialized sigma24 family protein
MMVTDHPRQNRTGPVLNAADKARFQDFVVACGRPLLRTAYLLTDSWEDAEALIERALTRSYLHWPRIEETDPTGATLHTLIRSYLDNTRAHRRARSRDLGEDETPLWRAARALSPPERTAVVLRLHGALSSGQAAAAMGLPQDRVAELITSGLVQVAEALGIGGDLAELRAVEARLRTEMAERVTQVPPAPARFTLVERRAASLRRAKVGAVVAVVLALVAAGSMLRDTVGPESSGAPVTARSTRGSAEPTKPVATGSGTAEPTQAPEPPKAPTGRLLSKLVLDGRVVELDTGSVGTVAELGRGSTWTVLAAQSGYVARRGPQRRPAALLVIRSDAKPTQLAKLTGSVAVNAARDWVAYSEVDAKGAATKLVLTSLADGQVVRTIEAPTPSTVVRGFVGDAVLLSQLDGDKEQARRWNPDANGFTDLGGRFAAVQSTHPPTKLALLGEVGRDCVALVFIEFGEVFDRGRDCDLGQGAARFSPDGSQFAVGMSRGTEIVVIETKKGLRETARIRLDAPLLQLAWDSDDAIAVVVGAESGGATVQRCVLASTECTTVWEPGTANVQFVR